MRKTFYLILLGCMTILTSCGTFWESMAQGYGGYGMGNQMFLGYTPPPPVPTAQQIFNSAPSLFPGYTPPPPVPTVEQIRNSAPPLVNSGGGTSATLSSSSSNSSGSSNSSSHDCRRCMGTGKCQTCNGRGYYDEIGVGSGRHACPNCASNHNGKCASCNGSGKM